MNDTNNNPVVGNTNGAVNTAQVPTTLEQPSTVVQPAQTSLALETAQVTVPSPPAPSQEVPANPAKTEQVNNSDDNEENKGGETNKKEFPYTAIIIGIILIFIAFAYYFFYITPTRVLDEAINDIFENIKSVASGITNPQNDTMEIDLKGKLRTEGREYEGLEDIKFLNNLIVNATIEADLKNLNLGFAVESDVKDTTGMKYPENIDLAIDSIGNKFYIEVGDRIAKYHSSNNLEDKFSLNYKRINDAVDVFEEMKNQVLDIIQEDQLSRSISTKKINNQTAIAIKAHVKLDNKTISDIYYTGFGNLLKSDEFIKKWANVFAITEEEATIMLQYINDRDVKTDNIEVNLYMNLANTQLIGFDVTVGNYYFELNSLNGFYYIDIKVLDNGFEVLDVEVEYDTYHGVLNGVGTLDVQTGYLIVHFDYTRIESEDTNKMTGNTLDFKFYDDDNGKPFCTLDFTLDIAYDKDINIANIEEAINIIELEPGEINKLITLTDKLTYETLFVTKKLVLNRLPANLADAAVSEYEKLIRDAIEKEIVNMVDAYLNELTPQQLLVLFSSSEEQQKLMKKISFMSDENKAKVLKIVSELKIKLQSGQVSVQKPSVSENNKKEETKVTTKDATPSV
ncbi:MAG: hypothetical protein PUA90_03800 [bacterium]|nr:hypothetical protein [bacterium]